MYKTGLLTKEERAYLLDCVKEEKNAEVHFHSFPQYETAQTIKEYTWLLDRLEREGKSAENDKIVLGYCNALRHLIDFWQVYFDKGKTAAFNYQKNYEYIQEAKRKKEKIELEEYIYNKFLNM